MRLDKLDLLSALAVCRRLREWDVKEAFATFNGSPDHLAAEVALSWGDYCWSVRADDGTPVAFIGATEQWPGCWRGWLLGTDRFPEVGRALTKWTTHSMIPGLIERGAHRIEAYSIDGHPVSHRWLRHLGFAEEARLRRYGRGGEDFLVFSILPGG